ncbi:MAG: DUF362 domain-containing protein [Candidatus Bathyarchaeota archaeon]|nr:DUF362 domain-containing protein [Candidatus Bathyarchaeota archaeon]
MKTVKIGVFRTSDGLEHALRNALNAAEWNKHIYGKIFIKPNLCAKEYIPGAVTNPQTLFHLVGLLRDKVEEVVVGESDGYNYSCDEALIKTGVKKIVGRAGGKTINLSKDETLKVQNPSALYLKKITLPKTLVEADSIVSVPVMKTHEFTLYGGAIKNLFGCVPNNRRIFLHPYLDMVLHDLMTLLKPKFAVMDATVAMEGNGPNRGIPIPMELMLASSDLLAIDKTSAEIMGINWIDVSHLHLIDKHLQEETNTQIIGEKIEALRRLFVRPYLDLAVKAQLWVYTNYFLTRLCFGTPLFNTLQACMKIYRRIDREIKGEKWTEKHWSNLD